MKTKEKIIEAAGRLFERFGFDKTSMDDIAKASHKTKGSLYYHFKDKDDVVQSVVNKEINSLKANLLPILTDINLNEQERVVKYLRIRMELLNKSGALHRILKEEFHEADSQCYSASSFDAFYQWESEQFTALITIGKNNSCIPDDVNTAAFVEMLMMLLKSLEIPFFVKEKYDYYAPTFCTLLDKIVISLTL
ncbi:MAG: TetR/AcrR family transcriptional regulator [Bacteroidales bacterium]|jgi:AcrR family transcriptional regulator|nr:TetR/AcrR family transcriptional regulator [Bacteroidales bacterium]MDD3914796.1 TetR/AcrR family transcriptional regulator [Bacteroidales bacterium]MDD4634707.1 TetR/AcrR family transcriptional regulator [Bacteroidales bacterium]